MRRSASAPSAPRQFAGFLTRFDPRIAALGKAALAKLRERAPGAVELVYDNYNALVIAFGRTERASDAVLSIALYPRWVNLFFLRGATLSDPQGLLKGEGTRVRRVMLEDAAVLDEPGVRRLIIDAAPPARQGWEILLDYNYRLNQAFARTYVVASSAAILLWSAAIVRTRTLPAGVAVYGLVMGSVAALAVVSGHVRLDVHGFGLIVLGQALWFIVVGAQLLRVRAG